MGREGRERCGAERGVCAPHYACKRRPSAPLPPPTPLSHRCSCRAGDHWTCARCGAWGTWAASRAMASSACCGPKSTARYTASHSTTAADTSCSCSCGQGEGGALCEGGGGGRGGGRACVRLEGVQGAGRQAEQASKYLFGGAGTAAAAAAAGRQPVAGRRVVEVLVAFQAEYVSQEDARGGPGQRGGVAGVGASRAERGCRRVRRWRGGRVV